MSTKPTFREERDLLAQGFSIVAGVDEVGTGSWAGPVYAAAVILPLNSRLSLIRDSKQLSPLQRDRLADQIKNKAHAWAIGIVRHDELGPITIRQAGLLAMGRAIEKLSIKPYFILSDAFKIPGLSVGCKNIIKGDAKVKSIAAASIIAKVERDRHMIELDEQFPGYRFAQHKGYGTKQHQEALSRLGPCPIHRMKYKPLASYIQSS